MTVTTSTIPCHRYDIVHHMGTFFDRVFSVRDAYGRPVDLSGKSYRVAVGLIDTLSIDPMYTTIYGTFPVDTDAQNGMVRVLIDPSLIDGYLQTNVPVGSMAQWYLEVEVETGRWERSHAGEFLWFYS